MDNQNKAWREVSASESVSDRSKPRLGILGLLLVLLVSVGGGLDILDYPTEEFTSVGYCGLFWGMIGGVLGIVSLKRGENKIASGISIVLGVLMLCTCGLLTLLIVSQSFFL